MQSSAARQEQSINTLRRLYQSGSAGEQIRPLNAASLFMPAAAAALNATTIIALLLAYSLLRSSAACRDDAICLGMLRLSHQPTFQAPAKYVVIVVCSL